MTAPFFEFSAESIPVAIPRGTYDEYGKRIFDLALLLLFSPAILSLMLLMVTGLLLTGGKPFYAQERVGRDGAVFKCWKIRTMVRDADAALKRILENDPELALEWAVNQKLRHDPRITVLGRFLRKSSLDELPQIWNVLRGDMSLVGPRPFTPEQRDLYPADSCGRISYYDLRPGITGLWQISRRNAGSFAERAHYDMKYASFVCFARDVVIVFRTFSVVLRGTGV